MQTSSLIDRVGSARRDLAGTFQIPGLPDSDNAFNATIEVIRSDAAVCFEGAILRSGATAAVPFGFTIPLASDTTADTSAELSCSLVGKVSGSLLSSADGFEFIGSTASVTVALHLRFTAQDAFNIGGMVFRKEGSLAFSASPATQSAGRVKAKVFAIRPVRD